MLMSRTSQFLFAVAIAASLFAQPVHAGVSYDTLIQTVHGPAEIGSLQQGDQVICFDNNLAIEAKSIESIESQTINGVIEITTSDDVVIRVAPEQKFFVSHKWVNAEDLSLNDILITQNKEILRIKSIRHLQEEETFYFIEVEDHHNFLATKNGILVHNGIIGAHIGTIAGATAVQGVYWGFTGLLGAVSGPAAPVVVGVWHFWMMAPLAVATNTAAVAGGLALAVATGPV